MTDETLTTGKVAVDVLFDTVSIHITVVDVCEALTGSTNPRRYWSDLKRQMSEREGFSELYDEIVQLPMPGADGKMYKTDSVNPETLFRIIQSIPSPRAQSPERPSAPSPSATETVRPFAPDSLVKL